jgi:hypothetical protein
MSRPFSVRVLCVHVLTLCLYSSTECKTQLAIPTLHGHLNCNYIITWDAPEPHPSRILVAIIIACSVRVHVLTLCLTSTECKTQLAIPTLHGHLNCNYIITWDAPEPHPSRNLVAIITFAASEPLSILLLPPASCSDCSSQYKSSHSLQIVSVVEMQGSCSN